jgi:hypothetical protein
VVLVNVVGSVVIAGRAMATRQLLPPKA